MFDARAVSLSIALSLVAANGVVAQTEAGPRAAPGRGAGIVHADVVALDHLLVYNRFGSFNPFGMIFALAHDVERRETAVTATMAGECNDRLGTERRKWDLQSLATLNPGSEDLRSHAGEVRLKDCKRPRPLTLRANVGDVLQVRLTNLLTSRQTPGVYKPASPNGAARENKPGFTETFCRGSTDHRFGLPPEGRSNDEDVIWSATRVACARAQGVLRTIDDFLYPRNKPEQDAPRLVAAALPEQDDPATLASADADWPATRHVSFVINGLAGAPVGGAIAPACTGLGALDPGQTVTCRWTLDREGTFFISSQAAVAGGEGDGGSLTHGLFGALIVEKKGAAAYRSQVTKAAFDHVWAPKRDAGRHARVTPRMTPEAYEAVDAADTPVLNLLQGLSKPASIGAPDKVDGERWPFYDVAHSVLNAVVSEPSEAQDTERNDPTKAKVTSFREFTAILHDELKTFYADNFQELSMFGVGQLAGVRDGFAINYGASGMGAMLIANRKRIGPAADCVECLYEEFFLQSWANGDPALLEHYPDDPSNVHHSYLNDRIVFRNFHAGPKETHVFHLHAHQWFAGNDSNRGGYLDSQTIGPQQGFSYKIYGGGAGRYADPQASAGGWLPLGAGNANRTPGDAIFHCHLYPHFAQGMWALWRNHDVLEDGSRLLPDGQYEAGLSLDLRPALTQTGAVPSRLPTRGGTDVLTGSSARRGTPVPGVIPLPDEDHPAPLLPTYGDNGMPGYPFFIPGQPGRRAPQPPLDMAQVAQNAPDVADAGLPRHVIESGVRVFGAAPPAKDAATGRTQDHPATEDKTLASAEMKKSAADTLLRSLALGDFSAHLEALRIKALPHDGDAVERRAMAFHFKGVSLDAPTQDLMLATADGERARYDPKKGGYVSDTVNAPFAVNGAPPRPGAPFADPCALPGVEPNPIVTRMPDGAWTGGRELKPVTDLLTEGLPGFAPRFTPDPGLLGFRRYEVSAIQTRMVVNRAGWHDPQARINILSARAAEKKTLDDDVSKKHGDLEPFFFRAFSGECIEFRHTNELPKDLDKDDFQVKTPTDTIGQHIHLVKFDVTSADGSGNGFNYEDGTFAPDEVRDRLCAARAGGQQVWDGDAPKLGGVELRLLGRACVSPTGGKPAPIHLLKREGDAARWFQTTVQRWFADPILSGTGRETAQGKPERRDRTLRTVFTHDHFGPSSIQQHGFYSALVIEPQKSHICEPEPNGACATRSFDPTQPTLALGGNVEIGARRAIIPTSERVAEERERITAAEKTVALSSRLGERDVNLWIDGLNTREYMLAVADFATVYDPRGKAWRSADRPNDDKGLACLAREARSKVVRRDPLAVSRACGGEGFIDLASLLRSGDIPPAALAPLDVADAAKLERETQALRDAHGAPVAPPRRPESISVDHHDPYLVNYRNEPLPLRVGADSAPRGAASSSPAKGMRSCSDLAEKGAEVAARGPERSIARQREGEGGEMANAFRSTIEAASAAGAPTILHADPCTPILEAYSGERVQVRLIQGAQEVQHMFTVEGYTFQRNIDQRLPAKSELPATWAEDQKLATRHRACFEADRKLPLAPLLIQARGRDSAAKDGLRAVCDNIDGRLAAAEIGISEHFEFGGAFNAEGNSNESERRIFRKDMRATSVNGAAPAATASGVHERKDGSKIVEATTGDSLYHFGSHDALWNGAWGLLRLHDRNATADVTACLSKAAPGVGANFDCAGPKLHERLPQLTSRARDVQRDRTVARKANVSAQPAIVETAADPAIVIECPTDGQKTSAIWLAAFNDENLAYTPVRGDARAVMRDPAARRLAILPDAIAEVVGSAAFDAQEALAQLRKTPREPLTLRVEAGACLTMKVVNLLRPTASIGEARLPPITSLNVGRSRWDKRTGAYVSGVDAGEGVLRSSERLALSIPVSTMGSRNSTSAPFGVNPIGASKFGEVQDYAIYAGAINASWEALDAVLADPGSASAEIRSAAPGCDWSSPTPSIPTFSPRHDPNAGAEQVAMIFGRAYWTSNDIVSWKGKDLKRCLRELAVATKTPRPYAAGPLPIKSFGDIIGHAAHGLFGALIVEPQGAQALPHGASARFSLPPFAHPAPGVPSAGVEEAYDIPPATVSEHALFWQDALNLGTDRLGRAGVGGRANGYAPVADCKVCDDSYDFGKRAVSYRSGMLAERLGLPAVRSADAKRYAARVHGAFDLNAIAIAKNIYTPTFAQLHLPALTSMDGDEVAIRVVHPGGRARQRAFVLTGAGYDDLFPGFGFANAALLAPGKAITAHLWRRASPGCGLWRDGPSLMVGQGVWGLHVVGDAAACSP